MFKVNTQSILQIICGQKTAISGDREAERESRGGEGKGRGKTFSHQFLFGPPFTCQTYASDLAAIQSGKEGCNILNFSCHGCNFSLPSFRSWRISHMQKNVKIPGGHNEPHPHPTALRYYFINGGKLMLQKFITTM